MRRRALAAVVAVALVIVAVVVVVVGRGDSAAPTLPQNQAGTAEPASPADVAGLPETEALLKGIPQTGMSLGDPSAPVTLLEYVDLQCPYCKVHQLDVQPRLIKELVRTKQAQIAFVPLAFLGSDSVAARNVFLRMAQTNNAWAFANLFFWNQGQENSGYVTDAFLRGLVGAIPGTSPADASKKLDPNLAEIVAQRDVMGQRVLGARKAGTPGFTVGPTGGNPLKYEWIDLYQGRDDADELITAVRKARERVLKGTSRPAVGGTA